MSGNGKIQGGKQYVAMKIGLRGTLAEEYEFRQGQNQAAATEWVRGIAKKAFDKSPDFLIKVELHIESHEKRYLIGLRKEVGMYPPDW